MLRAEDILLPPVGPYSISDLKNVWASAMRYQLIRSPVIYVPVGQHPEKWHICFSGVTSSYTDAERRTQVQILEQARQLFECPHIPEADLYVRRRSKISYRIEVRFN